MPATDAVNRFRAAAADAGLGVDVQRYPQGTRTAADAAAAVGCAVDQIVKSMVLVAGDEPVLVLCAGSRQVDLDAVAAHRGTAACRLATADEVRRVTGFAIGGTPPLGHPAAIPTLLDPTLTTFATVYAAAGTPDSVFPVDPSALATLVDATIADVTT